MKWGIVVDAFDVGVVFEVVVDVVVRLVVVGVIVFVVGMVVGLDTALNEAGQSQTKRAQILSVPLPPLVSA